MASLALPAVAGGGAAVRALAHADDAADALRAAARADDAADAARAGAEGYESGKVILYGSPSNPSLPSTRPGRDGKVSCTCLEPADGIRSSFNRDPRPDDRYWEVDTFAVQQHGGQIVFDGGQPIMDVHGKPLGGTYPRGHVSLVFPDRSKGWVERTLPQWLSAPRKVLAE